MSTFKGREGSVRFAGNLVGEVTSFDCTISAAMTDSTRMGDYWTKDEAVHQSWEGSLDCFWDPADTGQLAAEVGTDIVGSRIAVILYPKGSANASSTIAGTVTITEIGVKQAHDGLVARSIKYKGYGAPTLTGI